MILRCSIRAPNPSRPVNPSEPVNEPSSNGLQPPALPVVSPILARLPSHFRNPDPAASLTHIQFLENPATRAHAFISVAQRSALLRLPAWISDPRQPLFQSDHKHLKPAYAYEW